jgi:hypothetical protein
VLAQHGVDERCEGGVALCRFAPAFEEHAVATLEAEREGIERDARATLVDHRDDAQRNADAADARAVGDDAVVGGLPNGVGQACNGV